jgi:hypothetical protein
MSFSRGYSSVGIHLSYRSALVPSNPDPVVAPPYVDNQLRYSLSVEMGTPWAIKCYGGRIESPAR